jgi:hypothetical protein
MANTPRSLTTNISFLNGITKRVKLIGRLLVDGRVSPLLKLLPVGALVYLVVPTDLMPLLPFDDAAVLWLGAYLFIEMCPQDIVQEHMRVIDGESSVKIDEAPVQNTDPDVIEGEFHETKSGDPS